MHGPGASAFQAACVHSAGELCGVSAGPPTNAAHGFNVCLSFLPYVLMERLDWKSWFEVPVAGPL